MIRAKNGQRYVGSAQNLSERLVTRGDHEYQQLIEDPNSEVFTMTLDPAMVKGSFRKTLRAAEEFWIRALGAQSAENLNEISGDEAGEIWRLCPKYGLPELGPPIAH